MNLTLLTAAGAEAPESKFGFYEAMVEGGPVAWSILAIMIIMSVGSFYILFTKLFEQNKVLKQYKTVQTSFWRAASLKEGAAKLEKDGPWRQLADDAVKAQEEHGKMTDSLESHDYMHGSLQRSEDSINAVLAGGLPFLATVGATAPFVGLLGTVIGIYRALINIGIAGNASIDKVAGPVGEALIMTAIGLLVAVPAVFAFNWLQSRNRKISAMLSSFSNDLLAYMNSNGAVKPAVQAAPAAKPAAKPAAPANPTLNKS
ncbi:MAG: MotA/TolQ/ExbB proton channel family protein [Erythrobacter sp.]|uniref:MotA/TolQ/ExbB proton channel family protein n=1 Tax=Erythrobacter sp. TaxID=1042 RepID=UPI0025F1EA94|nr:MotA/TolQ/ExbB proton channel family protein [Erythrobacter sp.]MCM0001381.1 MotA/TolQ/ExbB proton channel family protein [Erythrobacter sp.]